MAEIQKLPVMLIQPSPKNPRKTFDEAKLEELAQNIEEQGLLQLSYETIILVSKHLRLQRFSVLHQSRYYAVQRDLDCIKILMSLPE